MTTVGEFGCFWKDQRSSIDSTVLRVNAPTTIVLHSTHSYESFDDLEQYHRSRGWAGVGYHVFIDKKHTTHLARPFDREGAHALGFNTQSIGVCFYRPHHELSESTIEAAVEAIETVQLISGVNEVIPHTLAQLRYFNRLFQGNPIPEPPAIWDRSVFQQYRSAIITLAQGLNASQATIHHEAPKFKNCPGEAFGAIIERIHRRQQQVAA